MAGNFNDTREDTENLENADEFDLDLELKDLTSFLQEMGVELEDEPDSGQVPEALVGDEITDSISFRFGEEDADHSEDILEGFLFGLDGENVSPEQQNPETEKPAAKERNTAEDAYDAPDAEDKSAAEATFDLKDRPAAEATFDLKDRSAAEATFDLKDRSAAEATFDLKDMLDAEATFDVEELYEGVDAENVHDTPDASDAETKAGNDVKELKKVEKEVDKALRKTFGKPFSWKREVMSWVAMFLIAFALAYVIDNYMIVNATVPTGSMQNTIMAGDRMIGWRLSYLFSDPERGDIIIFEYPDNPEEIYVKRVIGLPGETVTISDGKIYINDSTEPLEEDYLPEEWVWKNDGFTFVVPEDSYLCLGDNRNNSHDARSWTNTYVTKDAILGQAIVCYWPLEDFRWLN